MPFSLDFISGILSFLFTIMVLSYLLGDNPLFRLAIYIFIGVAAGYAGAVVWTQVLAPRLFAPLFQGSIIQQILAIIPLAMSVLLLTKISQPMARLGNPIMAFLAGVGAAVSIVGAVRGTLVPQIFASINLFDLRASTAAGINPVEQMVVAGLILLGTISTLVYFQFSVSASSGGKRNVLIRVIAGIGQVFIGITFGVLFAGALASAITALIERIHFIVTFISGLIF